MLNTVHRTLKNLYFVRLHNHGWSRDDHYSPFDAAGCCQHAALYHKLKPVPESKRNGKVFSEQERAMQAPRASPT